MGVGRGRIGLGDLKFKNPRYRRVKGSFMLVIRCGYCKTDIAAYQKVGKGGLLRMHIDRIVTSSVDLSGPPEALFCPRCHAQLATKIHLRRKNKDVFVMVRGAFNTRKG